MRSEHTMGFMDMRRWLAFLEKEGELRRITAEVDWNCEIGCEPRLPGALFLHTLISAA